MMLLEQALAALAWYAALVALMRLAGKRLAGQIAPFDLVVLVTFGVTLQQIALLPGTWSAVVFVAVVFAAHRGLALLCVRSARVRALVRGVPRPLVVDGVVQADALAAEGLSRAELFAGLRKAGHDAIDDVHLATLEETGQISVVGMDDEAPRAGAR